MRQDSSLPHSGARLRWSVLRPLPFLFALGMAMAWQRPFSAEADRTRALMNLLSQRGMEATPDDIKWLDAPSGVIGSLRGRTRAVVRGRTKGEPHDIWVVSTRLSPDGKLLEIQDSWNLTATTAVDESRPVFSSDPERLAYATIVDGTATSVHVLDLAGHPSERYADFTRVQRAQVAISALQQTGQMQGVVHDTYGLEPPARELAMNWEGPKALTILADRNRVSVDVSRGEATSGAERIRVTRDERAKPGNVVTWSVDRVRQLSWFGDEKMQWVKAIAFTGLDFVKASFIHEATASDIQGELGELNNAGGGTAGGGPATPEQYTDPETGWPPKAIPPVITPPLTGEGQWIALDKDPFITPAPGQGSGFVTTFIRPNKRRLDLRVFITLWDPRQIALHMESGTVEPVSATGERGPGLIPRTPEVMKTVVAAFNGGFQAQHGEYGMQANGIMYLPPKPYGATVMELRDGSTAFGTWPASTPVPDDVLGYRQNLTAMVQFDKWNPWGRTWWGGTPPGWADSIHTARSAICITKDNFVGYAWSASVSPDDLASALLAAGCQYGIHLDMNPGHAGFEFYNVGPASEWKPLGRGLQSDWEAEGKVSYMKEWNFRGRRMIKGMGHMSFPRYIQKEGRDFFYLTRRSILPGSPVHGLFPGKDAGESEWKFKGLPQHGFPYALAQTTIRPDGQTRVHLLRIDPRAVRPAGSAGVAADAPTVLTLATARGGHVDPAHQAPAPAGPAARRGGRSRDAGVEPGSAPRATPPSTGDVRLYYVGTSFVISDKPPAPEATLLSEGLRPMTRSEQSAGATAAMGIADETGMLHYVELAAGTPPTAATAAMLLSALEKLGCGSRMLVLGSRLLVGGSADAALQPVSQKAGNELRLVRGHAPGAHMMFEDVQLVPYSVWQPLMAARVKVEKKPSPAPSTKGR